LSLILPVNKALWTASFVLVTVGCAVPLWPLLSRMARQPLVARLLGLPILAGQTALTFYVAHMLLIALLIRRVNGVTLWEAGFEGFTRLGLGGAWASVLFALAAGALAFAPMFWLKKRGLLIRA
jgi:predicted acyltransferase